jgi:hypothetical protein
MAHDTHDDRPERDEFGAAGHETGSDEPSDLGSAGLYATPVHDEAEEAEEAGRREAGDPAR